MLQPHGIPCRQFLEAIASPLTQIPPPIYNENRTIAPQIQTGRIPMSMLPVLIIGIIVVAAVIGALILIGTLIYDRVKKHNNH